MAFSKELEEVIEAALADGVLTDKERAVLHKKALLEGVDPDELDVVIEGRLQQMQNAINDAKQKIRKCPSCGEIIPAMSAICPSCGQVIDTSNPDNKSLADYMENLEASLVKLKKNGASKYNNKVKAELERMIRQGRAMYGDNKKIAYLISEVEESIVKFDKAHKIHRTKISFIIVVLTMAVIVYFAYLIKRDIELQNQNNYLIEEIDNQYENTKKKIEELPIPTSKNYDECLYEFRKLAVWNKIIDDDGWYISQNDDYKKAKEHQKEVAKKTEALLNTYVLLLNSIENREYINRYTNEPTTEDWSSDPKPGSLGSGRNSKNPQFQEMIRL